MSPTLTALFALQWVLVIVLFVLVGGIFRYLAAIQERIEFAAPHITRYDIGEQASPFSLRRVGSNEVINSETIIGRSTGAIVLFLNATCSSCQTLLLQVEDLVRRHGELESLGWSVVLAFNGEEAAATKAMQDLPLLGRNGVEALIDDKSLLQREWGARVIPTGVALDKSGKVIDQSMNPHVNWLYSVLGVLPPEKPIVASEEGWETGFAARWEGVSTDLLKSSSKGATK